MTILAGVMSRRVDRPLDDSIRHTLSGLVSRHRGDDVRTFSGRHCALAKVDIGAFGSPAYRVGFSGSVAMVAGQPLLSPDGKESRSRDLEALHGEWDRGLADSLARACGVFCGAHYDPASRSLTLVTDKLGVRPLYYWVSEDYAAFATQLRILEGLPLVRKRPDLRGVVELATLGYPLGARTPYEGVALLRPAEIVRVPPVDVQRSRYWHWEDVPLSRCTEEELLAEAYERFAAAVTGRLQGDRATVAFLSGGLDSRCVVASLRSRGAAVHTFGFGQPGGQDQVFGSMFAARIGTQHRESPLLPEDELRWSAMMAAVWGAVRALATPAPERPAVVWSGDGGSVSLGHVYIERPIVDLLRGGRRDEAIQAFLEQQGAGFFRRFFHPDAARALAAMPAAGVREELDAIRCPDPVQAFYLFLMFNDQRRHLSAHFEGQDLHRLELQLPFFDSDFLTVIARVPVNWRLRHAFYTKWLTRFQPEVCNVPWQAYPDHVPCPLPAPAELGQQWSWKHAPNWVRYRRAKVLRQAAELLRAPTFPTELLRRRVVRLAATLYALGIRDYERQLAQVVQFGRYCAAATPHS